MGSKCNCSPLVLIRQSLIIGVLFLVVVVVVVVHWNYWWFNDDYSMYLLNYLYWIIRVQVLCLKMSLCVTVCTVTTMGGNSLYFRFTYALLSAHSRQPWLFDTVSQLVLHSLIYSYWHTICYSTQSQIKISLCLSSFKLEKLSFAAFEQICCDI